MKNLIILSLLFFVGCTPSEQSRTVVDQPIRNIPITLNGSIATSEPVQQTPEPIVETPSEPEQPEMIDVGTYNFSITGRDYNIKCYEDEVNPCGMTIRKCDNDESYYCVQNVRIQWSQEVKK